MALWRATAASGLFSKLINPIRSASRFFSTDTQVTNLDSDDRSVSIDRRSDRSVSPIRDVFSDVFDPFSPTRSLSQVLNQMDRFMESPFFSGGMGAGTMRRGWDVREDDAALLLHMDMPGLGKEDVKVTMEGNTLVIRGEGEKEAGDEDDESGRRYSSRLDLPPNVYKVDEIKAEMRNGVLKVVVPKAKEEENKTVFQVKVE